MTIEGKQQTTKTDADSLIKRLQAEMEGKGISPKDYEFDEREMRVGNKNIPGVTKTKPDGTTVFYPVQE